MGGALVRCHRRFPELKLAVAVEQPGHPALGQDIGIVCGVGKTGVLVTDAADAAQGADVWIDFTLPPTIPEHAAAAAARKKPLVVGTTGMNEDAQRAVRDAARSIPIVWSPNMSVGVNLLFALAEKAAAALGLDYDAEIVETHHRHKLDAPSGTALRLAERVAKGRGQDLKKCVCYGREGQTGERPRGQIAIHAIRAGDVVGDHTLSLSIEGERLELSHRATSRDTFAMGALRAAIWVAGRKPGLYDMADVLGLS